MTATDMKLRIDIRKEVAPQFKVHVQYLGMGWFRLGLWLVKIGCKIGGFGFVDEFPMSLIQPQEEIVHKSYGEYLEDQNGSRH